MNYPVRTTKDKYLWYALRAKSSLDHIADENGPWIDDLKGWQWCLKEVQQHLNTMIALRHQMELEKKQATEVLDEIRGEYFERMNEEMGTTTEENQKVK